VTSCSTPWSVRDRRSTVLAQAVRRRPRHQGAVRQREGARVSDRREAAHFLRASELHPELRAELPKFVAEIKTVFEPWEMREYLSGVRRLGALGHVASEEAFEEMRAAGAIQEDVVTAAEDVLFVERIKVLLLGGR